VTSPDAGFAAAANAAAAAFAATPPYITYRLRLSIQRGDASHDERFDVAFRTSDGKATVAPHDGASRAGAPPALPPALDALAQWAFSLDHVAGQNVMRVSYERPQRYAFATPGPDVDVVVPSIAGYSVRYAERDVAHIELAPATPEVRTFAAQPDHFVYRDVYLDSVTSLPYRVILVAPDEKLTLDYAVQGGAWLLSHIAYDAAERGAHGTIARYTVDATYDNYAFPAADPE